MTADHPTETPFRAGFVTFVGRPNVGKSTLTNALVGEKVAITSPKPQTTRRAIRAVVHRPEGQLVIVDTPGLHRPRTLLGQRLNDLVEATLSEVDVIGFCIPATEAIGPGDRRIAEQVGRYRRARLVAIVTKTDTATPEQVAQQLINVDELGREVAAARPARRPKRGEAPYVEGDSAWHAVVPVAADHPGQLAELTAVLLNLMPESPQLYPDEAVTDESLADRVAELIREAALADAREELPHSIAVTIDDIIREDTPVRIFAHLVVERDSQKGIVIGHQGSRIKKIGSIARADIEALMGERVHLDLRVRVAKEWQGDPKQLGRLGF